MWIFLKNLLWEHRQTNGNPKHCMTSILVQTLTTPLAINHSAKIKKILFKNNMWTNMREPCTRSTLGIPLNWIGSPINLDLINPELYIIVKGHHVYQSSFDVSSGTNSQKSYFFRCQRSTLEIHQPYKYSTQKSVWHKLYLVFHTILRYNNIYCCIYSQKLTINIKTLP